MRVCANLSVMTLFTYLPSYSYFHISVTLQLCSVRVRDAEFFARAFLLRASDVVLFCLIHFNIMNASTF